MSRVYVLLALVLLWMPFSAVRCWAAVLTTVASCVPEHDACASLPVPVSTKSQCNCHISSLVCACESKPTRVCDSSCGLDHTPCCCGVLACLYKKSM